MKYVNVLAVIAWCIIGAGPSLAQVKPERIHQFVSDAMPVPDLRSIAEAREFYHLRQYRPAWMHTYAREELFRLLDMSDSLGLDRSHYQSDFIQNFRDFSWRASNQDD